MTSALKNSNLADISLSKCLGEAAGLYNYVFCIMLMKASVKLFFITNSKQCGCRVWRALVPDSNPHKHQYNLDMDKYKLLYDYIYSNLIPFQIV